MERLREFIKSIFGGFCIGLGGYVFLLCENRYIGALLFCVGLISILMLGFNLFTGKIGYCLDSDNKFRLDTLLSIIGNGVGVLLLALPKPVEKAASICQAKLSNNLWVTLFNATCCGILIYLCVEIYKKKGTIVGVLFCIPTFILCGFEHSVANMFYLFNARIFSLKAVLFILVVLLGNAIGGLLIPAMSKIGVVKSIKKAD